MGFAARHRLAALIAAAMLLPGQARAIAESERLGLRPLKEPAHCVGGGACPLVSSPRVDDHRRSTIPGISNPDHGRPPIIVIEPLTKPVKPAFRSFGGHRGTFGGTLGDY